VSITKFGRVNALRRVPTGYWVAAAWVSGLVALASKVGNLALFALHPARHWPLLESIEALELVSMILPALLLFRLAGRSRVTGPLTAAGITGMGVNAAISVAWAAEWLTFGKEPVPMVVFGLAWLAILCWIVGASIVAWRAGSVSGILVGLAIATVLTGTFLYPVWAIWLGLDLARRRQSPRTLPAT